MSEQSTKYYTLDTLPLIYSSWKPDAETNNELLKQANITSNWKYRQYIQKHANNIMEFNSLQAVDTTGTNPYTIVNNEKVSSTPILFTSAYDTNNPLPDSDLKKNYIKHEQMAGRMIAPSISTNKF